MAEKRKITGKAFFNVFGKTANKLKRFFLCRVWQFPQMLAGFILVKITKAEKRVLITPEGKRIEWWCFKRDTKFTRFISGVSLAAYILLSDDNCNEATIKHEHGHSIQSVYFGWLYLPVIGIGSAVFCNMWQRRFQKDWNYYDRHYWYYMTRWTEKRADKLGGVDRMAVLRRIPRPANARYPAAPGQREA